MAILMHAEPISCSVECTEEGSQETPSVVCDDVYEL